MSDSQNQDKGEGSDSANNFKRKRNRRDSKSRDKRGKRSKESNFKDELSGPPVEQEGILEISGKGFGFLREVSKEFRQTPDDVFVTPEIVRNFGLRDGLWVRAETQMGRRGPQLTKLLDINGRNPDEFKTMPWFEELKAVNPDRRLQMETTQDRMTTRLIDLIAPIGRGQRGLIVAPPRSGKTTILQHLAEAVLKNHENVKVMVLLVDERPEEVTELRRALPEAEIYASSNDMEVKMHCRIAQIAVERAKRLVESGEDVFMLMDSITRLARAFNNANNKGGPTGTGGLTVRALEMPRKLFAAARNTRDAGSLTIIATALVETNSAMDDRIFEELKGTGNMELVLDRAIAEQYIYPAVDIFRSGTRREELLLPPHQWEKISIIRRGLAGHRPIEAIERMLSIMEKFPSNAQMLLDIKPMY
ncbi:MAG: transcription termination factor Rho [Verrucomicrobiales bacterium]|nr:transcription termination factor Rho [Verrucomicrobiales bacterium]MBD28006.1 transcription termination factor Rho [Verrucomicrobiaceae bacterium]MBV63481.1 transcription termination factor Rho [Rickettsiales bacterium]|tara:strand:+ start:1472 stop:2728 length:1257 start_codon:yes stop_codon:yes gene_type:complete